MSPQAMPANAPAADDGDGQLPDLGLSREQTERLITPTREVKDQSVEGIALCLSGGGYRAMLFHVGTLWRLNEFGLLFRLQRISSVSGGSITGAVLGAKWNRLTWQSVDNGGGVTRIVARSFAEEVVEPIRHLAGRTIDVDAITLGMLLPGSAGNRLARAYQKYLFGKITLQGLPDRPRFVINATNVKSGALWRFSKPYMADWRVGMVRDPQINLAVAVGASSAFPPFLSPLRLRFDPSTFTPAEDARLTGRPHDREAMLTDGGVYDNLGLEAAWKHYRTILISDGGGKTEQEESIRADWPRHLRRILEVTDNQVRSLRKRQVISSFQAGLRQGAYWGIRTDIREYQLTDALDCPLRATTALAEIPTRLKALPAAEQERLINWGYAVCDAAVRKHLPGSWTGRPAFPYPTVGVG
jgi:NTE family protein